MPILIIKYEKNYILYRCRIIIIIVIQLLDIFKIIVLKIINFIYLRIKNVYLLSVYLNSIKKRLSFSTN